MKYTALAIVLLCQLLCFYAYPENVDMEDLPVKGLSWSKNSNLTFYNYSNTDLSVWNPNANTAESGHWSSESTSIYFSQLSQIKYNRGFVFSFSIKNDHDDPNKQYKVFKTNRDGSKSEIWHENDVYWGFKIDLVSSTNTSISYKQHIADGKTRNSSNSYTDLWNSDTQIWRSGRDVSVRHYILQYDGHNTAILLVSENGTNYEQIKTFGNVTAIRSFSVILGSAAYVNVTNLSYSQESDYGLVKPEIDRAVEEYNKENYSGAIHIISRILNDYKSSYLYYVRGMSYASKKLYKPAIEDYTSALSYPCTDKLKRDIYFHRGISWLNLDNYDNGIRDMHLAGEEGLAFLKEYGLNEYGKRNNRSEQKNNTGKLKPSGNAKNSLEEEFQRLKKGKPSKGVRKEVPIIGLEVL